ncbi:kinase-like domain-containing protein [Scenedesmus sp. NREL 46B-D3]|nr:kinase-like domain-containing protein [Scenedesmus sp. NREL 46B-D3]
MSSKHRRDRDGASSRQGSAYGRDGRDRDSREPSWQRDGRDSRPGSSQPTPPKPSRGGAAAGGRGPVLGGSAISNAILEAAKRRAQEQQQAAQAHDDGEQGEADAAGGPRKRPGMSRLSGAHRRSSRKQQLGTSKDYCAALSSALSGESLQERLAREAAEFRQQLHQAAPAAADSAGAQQQQHQRQRHHHRSRGRSPSSSDEEGEEGRSLPKARIQGGGGRRKGSRSSSRSRSSRSRSGSRSSEGGGSQQKKVGGRWQADEEEEQQQQQQQQQKPGKSRWFDEEEEEGQAPSASAGGAAAGGGAGGDLEEGEAPGAAIDEELEALNRDEAGAGSDDESNPLAGGNAALLSSSSDDDEDEAAFQKNLLEESRRVEEYERLNRIQGTFGVVHRARCKATGAIYALKKLKLEQCPDGFPQTSVREMNVLLSLNHPKIVNVAEVVIGSRDAVYMVMEYLEHDLKYVLELQQSKKTQPFSIGQVKCLMQQLLEGVQYLHEHWVIHRDLKTSNLLYSNNGELKICDFGLARQYGSPLRPFTPMVVTLWYRAIERLLGDPLYSTALDMWSVGCIMGELILGEPLFQGRGEIDQIKRIFALLGTPTQEEWPGWDQLPDSKNLQWKPQESQLRKKFPMMVFGGSQPILNDTGFSLLSRLLDMNPATRITAADALQHPWFAEAPRAVNPALMPSFPQRHAQGKDGGLGTSW